jgi:hypothetical protein
LENKLRFGAAYEAYAAQVQAKEKAPCFAKKAAQRRLLAIKEKRRLLAGGHQPPLF